MVDKTADGSEKDAVEGVEVYLDSWLCAQSQEASFVLHGDVLHLHDI